MEVDFKRLSLFHSPTQTSSSFKLTDILKVNTTDTTKKQIQTKLSGQNNSKSDLNRSL